MIIYIFIFITAMALGALTYYLFFAKNNTITTTTLMPITTTTLMPMTTTLPPVNINQLIVGCGLDGKIYTKNNLNSPWEGPIQNNLWFNKVIQIVDGSLVGFHDKKVWLKKNLNPENLWDGPKFGIYKYTTQFNNGNVIGVGDDGSMYYSSSVSLINNSCCVKAVIQLKDGTILGIGTDNQLYTKNNLEDRWNGTGWNSQQIIDIAQLREGTLLGVGSDNLLYKRNNLTEQQWTKVDDTLRIQSISVFKYL